MAASTKMMPRKHGGCHEGAYRVPVCKCWAESNKAVQNWKANKPLPRVNSRGWRAKIFVSPTERKHSPDAKNAGKSSAGRGREGRRPAHPCPLGEEGGGVICSFAGGARFSADDLDSVAAAELGSAPTISIRWPRRSSIQHR
jgi:hypothetical protein